MTDRDALKLAQLLAAYATEYGIDSGPDMTVTQLADDLATGNTDPALTAEMETARDAIHDGMERGRPPRT